MFPVAAILVLRRLRPHWPGFLIAVALGALAVWLLALPVETIGTKFGESRARCQCRICLTCRLPGSRRCSPALSFTLLGAIEPVVGGGRRQRPDAAIARIASWLRKGRPQYRVVPVRRNLRDRHLSPDRDQCPRRRARADRGMLHC